MVGMSDIKTRKSIPLDEDDLRRIAVLTAEQSPSREVLTRLYGDTAKSEASMLHLLIVAGLDHIEHEAAEAGYAALAAAEDDEDRAFDAAMRGRRA